MRPIHVVAAAVILATLIACSSKDKGAPAASQASDTPAPASAPKTTAAPAKQNAAPMDARERARQAALALDYKPPLAIEMPDVPGEDDAVVLFPDGIHLATCGDDGMINLYAVPAVIPVRDRYKQPITGFQGIPGEPRLAVSKSGTLIAQASRSNPRVEVWNIETKSKPVTLEGHEFPISDLKFSPDSSQLAASSLSAELKGSVRVWNLSTTSNPVVLEASGVSSIDFSPDGKHLASAANSESTESGQSSTVKVWDLAGRTVTISLENKFGPTHCVAYSPDGNMLAIAERNGLRPLQCVDRVRLVDPRTGAERGILTAHADEIHALAFNRDGSFLLSAGRDAVLRIWQVPTKSIRSIRGLGNYRNGPITFSSDDKRFAVAAADPYAPVAYPSQAVGATVWNFEQALQSEQNVPQLPPPSRRVLDQMGRKQIVTLAFSDDGKRLASSTKAGETSVFDTQTWTKESGFTAPNAIAAAFSPDLSKAVVLNETLQIRDVRGGTDVQEVGQRVRQHQSRSDFAPGATISGVFQFLHTLALSPDGRVLVTANNDGLNPTHALLKFRNFKTTKLVAVASHPEGVPTSSALSLDGRRLVTGGGAKIATQRIDHSGPISFFKLRDFVNRKDSTDKSLKRPVQRDISKAEQDAFAQAFKIYKNKGSDDDLRSVLQSVASELDEIKVSPEPLDLHWQMIMQNQASHLFDAVKFRIPEGNPVDFTWMMNLTPWVVDCDVIALVNPSQPMHKREVLSQYTFRDGANFQHTVMRALCGPGVSPGTEFVIWFVFGEPVTIDGMVAVNLLPRGYLDKEGITLPPSDDEAVESDVPIARRMHLFFHGDSVRDVAITHDGTRVASAGADGSVKVWDVDNEKVIATCRGTLVKFSPDGKMLATADIQQETPVVLLHDAATGQKLQTLQGIHFIGISALAFSPDGKRLAVGGRDGMISTWDTSTGKPD